FYNDRVAEGTRTFEVSPDGRRVELTRDEIDHRMIQAAMDLQRGTRPNPMLVQAVSVFLTRWFKEHQVVRRRTG
ncbi:MAG: hypothetical protein J0L61_07285, partial [Planctomycetes bacterium]|nr:hypothetical protein [Planctomycetota bacterium]